MQVQHDVLFKLMSIGPTVDLVAIILYDYVRHKSNFINKTMGANT